MTTQELEQFCAAVRRDIINVTANAGSGHPGGSLSAVELMIAAFCTQMRVDPKNRKDPNRDRFVLSKGHAAPCYYGVLAELGFFSKEEFKNFRQLHSILQGHPDAKKVPGVDASTGSLGQGVSIAVVMALAAKHMGKDTKVFAMCGDGGGGHPGRPDLGGLYVRCSLLSWTTSPSFLITTAFRSTAPMSR